MKRVTEEQVGREIERNEKEWVSARDRLLPTTKDDPVDKEIAFLCSRWFFEKLVRCGHTSISMDIADAHCVRLVAELSRCLGCSHGKRKLAVRVTADAWNDFVKAN